MSSVLVSYKRKLKDLKDERDMWRRMLLEEENELEVAEFDPNQVSRDPFQLPDPCIANILKYLSGKELLDVMEVCKHWKNTIEGHRAIMDRAMDKVLARFTDSELLGDIGSCVSLKRPFKHMRVFYPSYFRPDDSIYLKSLVGNYASSLVTLYIECICMCVEEEDFTKLFQPVNFPHLKSLTLSCQDQPKEENMQFPSYCMTLHRNLVKFIKSCSFPEVKKLSLSLLSEYELALNEFDLNLVFTDIVCNMPKLRVLSCDMISVNAVQKPENLPQLEILVSVDVDVSVYFHSLKELYIFIDCSDSTIRKVLISCKLLRVLHIGGFKYEEDTDWLDNFQFPRHNNMEKFIIAEYCADNCEWHRGKLHNLLPAFPKLKVLVINSEIKRFDTLEFLAMNMANLEKLICKELSTSISALQYFSTLSEENRLANVTIQVEEDPHCCPEAGHYFFKKFYEFDM